MIRRLPRINLSFQKSIAFHFNVEMHNSYKTVWMETIQLFFVTWKFLLPDTQALQRYIVLNVLKRTSKPVQKFGQFRHTSTSQQKKQWVDGNITFKIHRNSIGAGGFAELKSMALSSAVAICRTSSLRMPSSSSFFGSTLITPTYSCLAVLRRNNVSAPTRVVSIAKIPSVKTEIACVASASANRCSSCATAAYTQPNQRRNKIQIVKPIRFDRFSVAIHECALWSL